MDFKHFLTNTTLKEKETGEGSERVKARQKDRVREVTTRDGVEVLEPRQTACPFSPPISSVCWVFGQA